MEVSPSQGGVILEAKINPVDIGRVKLGLPVTIKLKFGRAEGLP
jgi:adhesin transport system membrane fusion protein